MSEAYSKEPTSRLTSRYEERPHMKYILLSFAVACRPYVPECVTRGVWRRYRDFASLHQLMSGTYPPVLELPFPPKHIANKQTAVRLHGHLSFNPLVSLSMYLSIYLSTLLSYLLLSIVISFISFVSISLSIP